MLAIEPYHKQLSAVKTQASLYVILLSDIILHMHDVIVYFLSLNKSAIKIRSTNQPLCLMTDLFYFDCYFLVRQLYNMISP